jgi:hypothetical protein
MDLEGVFELVEEPAVGCFVGELEGWAVGVVLGVGVAGVSRGRGS